MFVRSQYLKWHFLIIQFQCTVSNVREMWILWVAVDSIVQGLREACSLHAQLRIP